MYSKFTSTCKVRVYHGSLKFQFIIGLLGQTNTHINSNIWLNVPWAFLLQLGAFDDHPPAPGSPLAGF